MSIKRRSFVLAAACAAPLLAACSRTPPLDEAEVNRVVSHVNGVTSAAISVEPRGTVDWSLTGEIGLPDDRTQALAIYDSCLRAIASVVPEGSQTMMVYVYGISASGEIDPDDVGAPDGTQRLVEHYK